MTLSAGTRLGIYEISSALGAGGMGEVYRARDTKLGRDVALKILPDSFAHDPERLARFKREAQVLAALNHPHIGAIYGLEESPSASSGQAGTQFLVLELVEGGTLAQRLEAGGSGPGRPPSPATSRQPLALDEALAIARQIADALDAAHEKGIIHRDLKPANIALTANDQVKVLDFGLAKALGAGGASESGGAGGENLTHSPTLTMHATQAGVILGTAAYMSPEQAKGRAADKRSDVWAFGCVLFEMLTGTRAFEGEDVSDTLATILKGQPEWSRLPADVPPPIRTLIARCLEKDRKQRIADIAVVRYILDEPAAAAAPATTTAPETKTPRSRWAGFAAAFVAAFIAAAGGWTLKPSPKVPLKSLTRFPIMLGADQSIIAATAGRHLLALSPDGTRLVYAANNQLFLRTMDQLDAAPIRGTTDTPFEPVFSPDGQWVAYHSGTHLKKIAVTGGAPTTICWIWDVKGETLTRLTFDKSQDNAPLWTRDGKRVIYTSGAEGAPNLYWKPADGTGVPERLLAKPPPSSGALVPNSMTPDGKELIYSVGVPSDIMVLPLGGDRQPRALIAQASFAERGGDVSPDGKWIAYYSDESGTFQVYVRPYPDVNSGRWQVSGDGGILPKWSPNGRELFYVDARASREHERGAWRHVCVRQNDRRLRHG